MPSLLTLAHSPDPDDVFMWWPLGNPGVAPAIDTEGLAFECFPEDIQALNRRAIERADLDITAVSIHAYPAIAGRYRLTDCAGSWGEGYGPKLIVRGQDDSAPSAPPSAPLAAPNDASSTSAEHASRLREWLAAPRADGTPRVLAIPGVNTTAFLTLSILLGARPAGVRELIFHAIPDEVASGRADAGLLIHDAQLTFGQLGLRQVVDLGAWWDRATGLPLPLGGNVVSRGLEARLGPGGIERVGRVLRRSIEHAITNWDEGLRRIAPMTVGIDASTLDRYLKMYVNQRTVDAGGDGRRAVRELFARASRLGLGPLCDPDWLECGPGVPRLQNPS